MRIVDWEYAGMDDRYFDLGNLAVNNGLDEDDETRLLEAYLGAPPTRGRLASLRLMRLMSDVREAMWGVVQARRQRARLRLRAPTRPSTSRRLREGAADPRLEDWMPMPRPRELPDRARVVIIGGGVGGTSHRLPPRRARRDATSSCSTATS